MKTPPELRAAEKRENIVITTREYADETIIAVDFGPSVAAPTLDIVDDTAIVVLDDQQFEFGIPPEATDVTLNDGILTIKD